LADAVQMAAVRSICYRDIVIFRFYEIAATAILDLRNSQISLSDGIGGPRCIIMPNFVIIGQSIVENEISRFFSFSRWWPSAILDLFGAYSDNPRRVLGSLCHCAKFGCNRCSSFENM